MAVLAARGQAPDPIPLAPTIEPYRVLFPMGWAFGLAGASVWLAAALGLLPYPGLLHRTLMMQGFEQCFVLGFLLTALPAFTHGPRCGRGELGSALAAMTLVGAGAWIGLPAMAQGAFLLSLGVVATAGLRRIAGNPNPPPEEFLFVGFGLLLGALGGTLLLASSLGAEPGLPARFAERLLSLGMVLSLVMGVGSLLVPTFAGMRDPLVIRGVAGPHQRGGRRALYMALIAGLASAFMLEAAGRPGLGMAVRTAAVTTIGLWVWKLTRLPRRDVPGFTLWGAGWLVMAGLWVALLAPAHAAGGLHVTFLGGFGLLTMGIATRVVVAHGKHPLEIERRVLDPWVLALLALSLLFRLRAEWLPDRMMHALAGSALFWSLAWLVWAIRVLPLVLRPRGPTPVAATEASAR